MENINYNIKNIVDGLTKTYNVKSNKISVTPEEYVIYSITENNIIEYGFKYIGKSSYVVCPMYTYGNISGFFNENEFHLIYK